MSWDQCRSLTKTRGGSVWLSGTLVPQRFDSASFLLGCYLHTCCHGTSEEAHFSIPVWLSCTHANVQINTLQASTYSTSALTTPKHLLLAISFESMGCRVYFSESKNIPFVLVHLTHQGPRWSRDLTKEVKSETVMIMLKLECADFTRTY